jgi:hypothetical protein
MVTVPLESDDERRFTNRLNYKLHLDRRQSESVLVALLYLGVAGRESRAYGSAYWDHLTCYQLR